MLKRTIAIALSALLKTGHYVAYVSYDGRVFSEPFDVTGTITVDGSGNTVSSQDNNDSSNDEPAPTVTTTQSSSPPSSSVGNRPSNPKPAPRIIESIQLGDHITGTIYNNGYLNVYGYGDMYDFGNPVFSYGNTVKQIYFQDKSPDDGLVITSIGKHVFDGFTSLNN